MSVKSPAPARSKPAQRTTAAGLGAPPRPQVNLLPPEVRSRRALGRVKVRLVLGLAGVLVLCAGGYVYAQLEDGRANRELTAAQDEVARLQAEQAEYSEVPRTNAEIQRVKDARLFGTSTEIIWTDYWRAIEAVAPAGWSLASISTQVPTPLQVPVLSTNPLAEPSVGVITFAGRAASLPDLAEWAEGLETIPGFSDPSFQSAQVTGDEGVVYYLVAATVNVNADAFAPQPAEDEEAE